MPEVAQEDGVGRYRVRYATGATELRRAQALRYRAFRAAPAISLGGGQRRDLDADRFDARCQHVLIEARATGRLVAVFRLLVLADGREIGQSYAAQFYGLSALRSYPGRMVEVGRFCMDPECHDPDVLRIAWAEMTRLVEREQVGMLFGCSSFAGTDAGRYLDAFAMLRARHLGPKRWLPKVKAPKVFRFGGRTAGQGSDPRRGLQLMPPLLRSYLTMGGWVSDHAVVDEDLGTLHVFTGVEVSGIPPARVRALRLLAG